MKKTLLSIIPVSLILLAAYFSLPEEQNENFGPEGRAEQLLERIMDPATGKVPEGIFMREQLLVSQLPKAAGKRDLDGIDWVSGGPYNVGGRTRALAVDISDTSVILAGGVSGGMWRSADGGQSWDRVSPLNTSMSVSCVEQDQRPGNTNVWYYGGGEANGNSASKSFSASYIGVGIFKSTDGGATWNVLQSTATDYPQANNGWGIVFGIEVDQTRQDSAIVYAALPGRIMRSNDGGDTWETSLQSTNGFEYGSVQISATGVLYAAFDASGKTGAFWRSTDGFTWTDITPSIVNNNLGRTRIAIAPSDESHVYFYSDASGAKLYHYEYLSGNGAGTNGAWDNRTGSLPTGNQNINPFGGYCMSVGVHPLDHNTVFVGGTNLYRSTNGFASSGTNRQVGGYRVAGNPSFEWSSGIQHPDQQEIFFNPLDANIMYASSDGGVHKSPDCTEFNIQWESLSEGYQTSQFYGIGIDHATDSSQVIVGGLQDNGSWYANTMHDSSFYASVRGADGGYSMVADGGEAFYLSTQYANIQRVFIDSATGNVISRNNIMPNGAAYNYRFTHPFTLDPRDTDIMYLPNGNDLWVNSDLSMTDNNIDLWTNMLTVSTTANITSVEVAPSNPNVVYAGTNGRDIFRVDNARSVSNATSTKITSNIATGAFLNSIGVDPEDEDELIVVYSNYNVQSMWYTQDAGANWETIEGNLKGDPLPGAPPNLYYIGNGPSIRWVEIVATDTGRIYLLGTSVGLFATDSLNGEDTEWVQQSPDLIGNAVVDMIDVRASDGFVAIGTHGNGLYHGYIDMGDDAVSGIQAVEQNVTDLTISPNPVKNIANLTFNLATAARVQLSLFDMQGRQVQLITKQQLPQGQHSIQADLNNVKAGNYVVVGKVNGISVASKLVKL